MYYYYFSLTLHYYNFESKCSSMRFDIFSMDVIEPTYLLCYLQTLKYFFVFQYNNYHKISKYLITNNFSDINLRGCIRNYAEDNVKIHNVYFAACLCVKVIDILNLVQAAFQRNTKHCLSLFPCNLTWFEIFLDKAFYFGLGLL